MSGQPAACAVPNLTELEIAAIESGINVADGHARYDLTSSQQEIISDLPGLFARAATTSVAVLDAEAQRAFLSAIGQHTAVTEADVLSCYSSSVGMEILGRALYAVGVRTVALIHPTFDSIPDILRGIGMALVPVSEAVLMEGSGLLPAKAEALLITTPNNPTGAVLPREVLAHWARVCAARGVILALDTSFRGFDPRAQYDHYAVLAAEGCRYTIIEDTGKLWPTLDLKAGFLAFPRGDQLPIRGIYTDLLLGISPLILLLVRQFADDARAGGFRALQQFVADNRRLLRGKLTRRGRLTFPDPDSRICVERVTVPSGTTGTAMWHTLRDRGIHVLPCRQFHWADPWAGEKFVRVALSRPPGLIAAAADAIDRQAELA